MSDTATGAVAEQVARSLIAEGEAFLWRAYSLRSPVGPFQLEAAIQSAHCDRARTGTVDRERVVHLYRGLVAVAPTARAVRALAAATAASGRGSFAGGGDVDSAGVSS